MKNGYVQLVIYQIHTLINTQYQRTLKTMINHSPELVNTFSKINCTNCGIPSPTSQQPDSYIDNGISIDVNTLGHYGGFTDNFPGISGNSLAHLCHDCSVIMFNSLPGLAKFAQVSGSHGNITGGWSFSGGELSHIENGTEVPPCCPYAWTWDRTDKSGPYDQSTVYISTPELTWEKMIYKQD
jgi:hypothetical protein